MCVLDRSAAQLQRVLREAWASDTTSDPRGWTPTNPAWGQCAVTALIVQDLLGGELLRAPLEDGSHYWNRLPDGTELDLTREQFGRAYVPMAVERRSRDYVLSFDETRLRYETLWARLRRLGREGGDE